MSEYKGTYNPDKKRGELLKDGMSTGEYFKDLDEAKGKAAESNATERRSARVEQQKPIVEELKKTVNPFKKGGAVKAKKVAGKLATRGYGKAR